MFTFLRDLPNDRVVGGVYYAARIISHSKQIKNLHAGYAVDGIPAEPTRADQELGGRIVDEIEQVEKKPLTQLSQAVASQYIRALASLLQEILKQRLKYDETRGARLLEQLRRRHRSV
jgi:hypothetical protein